MCRSIADIWASGGGGLASDQDGGAGGGPLVSADGGVVGSVPSVTGPVTASADGGVFTSHSNVTFTSTGGNLTVTSAYFIVTELSTDAGIEFYGDIRNDTSDTVCVPLADVLIGGIDITTVVDAPAYDIGLTSSSKCLEPGESGVFSGVDASVPATILDGPVTFEYDINGQVDNGAVPHPSAPIISSEVVGATGSGFAMSGTFEATGDIYNLSITYYVRDTSGLIRDDVTAYPRDLADILTGTTEPFETGPTPDVFDQWVRYSSFITGASGTVCAPGFDTAPAVDPNARWDAVRAEYLAEKALLAGR